MRIPGPKWGARRPPLETPKSSLARYSWPNSSPLARLELRCRWGKRERIRARHGCRTSTASGWGLTPPGPPRFPKGERLLVMHALPHVPQREKSADHARTRMGQRSKRLLRQRLRKSPGSSCREAARSSVTPLARIAAAGRASATAEGESQRGRSPLWPVFAYFLLARK